MTPGSPTATRPLLGAGLDTTAGASFVQDRLTLLAKVIFCLAFGFYAIINLLFLVVGGAPLVPLLLMQHNVWHLASVSIMVVLWLICRGQPRSIALLGLLDAAVLPLAGVGLSLMAAQPNPGQLSAAILAITVTAMARAVLIPSTATRTALLCGLASLPILTVAILFHRPAGFVGVVNVAQTVLWLFLASALSTVTSRTIYGLRQQVKEAAEIGQYTLEAPLGSGGMGEVWRARHRMLIRPAAVKLIRPQGLGSGGGDPQVLLKRFEREARATAGLRSPHTVQLYDFGVTDDGTLYYVMELLDGLDLDSLIERFGPMPPERAVHILRQVCSSLDEAHRNGLVHRDIKPANIVVSRINRAYDFVKVLDFGLVKLAGSREPDDNVRLTADGSTSGTPAFMAPEIVLGEKSDHRVDLYSLGCVAYWLVTGQLVFEGPGAMKVMLAHAHTVPPPPSSRGELSIPPELEALILECLAKDPAARPESAAALEARLEALPLPPWTRDRAEKWWSTHAPAHATGRPVADMLLSQEARPPRVIRQARG